MSEMAESPQLALPAAQTNFERAIDLLNSRKERPKEKLENMRGSDDMDKWLEQLGYSAEHVNTLNVIHIAGTNGKGSTAAWVESFLNKHRAATGYPKKIGSYTSPHLTSIRERIRLNGALIEEDTFARRLFEVLDRLPKIASASIDVPRYLQLLALVAIHIFIKEGVDAAILETHMGGEYDATNVVTRPRIVGITPIGRDHIELLGPTIEDIAWHKAGIFKRGSFAFSAPQEHEASVVLEHRASERGSLLKFTDVNSELPRTDALRVDPQRINCSLALALVHTFLEHDKVEFMKPLAWESILHAIHNFAPRGRFHRILDDRCQWFLDGAHNEASVNYAVDWFVETASTTSLPSMTRVLVFAHFSKRDGVALLQQIANMLQRREVRMAHVIITSYDGNLSCPPPRDKNMTRKFSADIQERYASFWRDFDPTASVSCQRTIRDALGLARRAGESGAGMQTFLTGSLHLVGGALSILESCR